MTLDEARRLDRLACETRRRLLKPIAALARDLFEPLLRSVETPG